MSGCACGMKICFHLKFQGKEKIKIFSQESYGFQILRNGIMMISGYEDINIFSFHLLVAKLWPKEVDDLHTSNL